VLFLLLHWWILSNCILYLNTTLLLIVVHYVGYFYYAVFAGHFPLELINWLAYFLNCKLSRSFAALLELTIGTFTLLPLEEEKKHMEPKYFNNIPNNTSYEELHAMPLFLTNTKTQRATQGDMFSGHYQLNLYFCNYMNCIPRILIVCVLSSTQVQKPNNNDTPTSHDFKASRRVCVDKYSSKK